MWTGNVDGTASKREGSAHLQLGDLGHGVQLGQVGRHRKPRRPLSGRALPELVAHAHAPPAAERPAEHGVGEVRKVNKRFE
jgi:hypothetical protein